MQAMICMEFGPPERLVLGELPTPAFGLDEVMVETQIAGVSFADTLMIRNQHQNKHVVPFAPGMEVAGTVGAVGSEVTSFRTGQRVMALVYDGGYAELVAAKAEDLFEIPDEVSFEQAAAMGSIHLTSHAALRWEARIEAGERLLVLGAGSGVGLAAVGIAKAMGAWVIAAASSADKLTAARAQGADEVIEYSAEGLKERALSMTRGAGVDVVFDPVGGELHEDALASLDAGGRYLVIGFAGGAIPRIPANRLLVKNRAALGFVLMHYRRRRNALLRRSWGELMDMLTAGTLRPTVYSVRPLSKAPAAMRDLIERTTIGKTVLDVHADAEI